MFTDVVTLRLYKFTLFTMGKLTYNTNVNNNMFTNFSEFDLNNIVALYNIDENHTANTYIRI